MQYSNLEQKRRQSPNSPEDQQYYVETEVMHRKPTSKGRGSIMQSNGDIINKKGAISFNIGRIIPRNINHDKQSLYEENFKLKQEVQMFKNELLKLKTRLVVTENQKDKLVEELNFGEDPARNSSSRMKGNNKSFHKIQSQTYMKKLIRENKQMITELKSENIRLKKTVKYTQISELQIQNKYLHNENERLKSIVENKIMNSNEHIEGYQNKINELRQELQIEKNNTKKIVYESKKKNQQVQNLKKQLIQVVGREKKLKRDLQSIRKNSKGGRERLDHIPKDNYINKPCQQCQESKEQFKKFKNKIEELEEEIKELRYENEQAKKFKSQIEELKEEIKELRYENEQAKKIQSKQKLLASQEILQSNNKNSTIKIVSDHDLKSSLNAEKSQKNISKSTQPKNEKKNENNTKDQKQKEEYENQDFDKNQENQYDQGFQNEEKEQVKEQTNPIKKPSEQANDDEYNQQFDENQSGKEQLLYAKEQQMKEKSENRQSIQKVLKQTITYRLISQRYTYADLQNDIKESGLKQFTIEQLANMLNEQPFFLTENQLEDVLTFVFGHTDLDNGEKITAKQFLKNIKQYFIGDFQLINEEKQAQYLQKFFDFVAKNKKKLNKKFNQISKNKEFVTKSQFVQIFTQYKFSKDQIELLLAQASLTSLTIQQINYNEFINKLSQQ